MTFRIVPTISATALAAAMLYAAPAYAAEGFQLRYNLAGTLGGEMFAPPDQSGLVGGIAFTNIDITKVTGNDGNPLRTITRGGTVPLPAPAPTSLYPTYAANQVQVNGTGSLAQWNLALGYLTTDSYGGGRFVYGLNLPYATKKQNFQISGATPVLNWPNPSVPNGATQAAAAGQFNRVYQGGLTTQGAAQSGEVAGLGDAELQAGWLYSTGKLRMLVGASLVLPTGKYDSNAAVNIGYGNFYTFRPAVQVAYLPTPEWAVSGKFTLGFNSKNKDNDIRSGDWASLEAATGYMTPLGPIGLHAIHVQQYEGDKNNPWGSSRLRSTNAGVFFTTKLPALDAVVTLQYMATLDSRNAKSGRFTQIRMIKSF